MVSTEPTDCQVYRGQRGRMEIRIDVQGVSCHGSAPERGDNAIFKIGPILGELQELSQRLGYDEFLAKAPSPFLKSSSHPKPLRCSR